VADDDDIRNTGSLIELEHLRQQVVEIVRQRRLALERQETIDEFLRAKMSTAPEGFVFVVDAVEMIQEAAAEPDPTAVGKVKRGSDHAATLANAIHGGTLRMYKIKGGPQWRPAPDKRAAPPDLVATNLHSLIWVDDLIEFARNHLHLELGSDTGAAALPSAVRVHRATSTRRTALDPLIEDLVRDVSDPSDHTAIWNAFQALADSKTPPAPLTGIADGEVKYRSANGDITAINREAFIKRLKRRQPPSAAASRH